MSLDPTSRQWQAVRLILGFLQMGGAVFSATLIVLTGINRLSLASVVSTCVLTSVSVVLFGTRKSHNTRVDESQLVHPMRTRDRS